ncbi:MAG: hypothetical protein ABWK15_03395 [Dissulfuribacterales bacterium]
MAVLMEEVQTLNTRVTRVEDEFSEIKAILKDAAYLSMKNEMAITQLSHDMQVFRIELREDTRRLKEEMTEFKNEMRQEFKLMNKKWGDLANKMGTLVEDIFFPGAAPLIQQYFKDEPNYIAIRVKKRSGELQDEFDIIAVSGQRVYLFEIKSSPNAEKAREFKNEKIASFQRLFPEYSHLELVPLFGGLTLEKGLITYLTKLGIYAVAFREWEYLDILNFEEVKQITSSE